MNRRRSRTSPGEVLAEEFMKPLGISARALAANIGVPGNRISDIVRGHRELSADTAIRLSIWSGTSAQFWLNLQAAHSLSMAQSAHDYTKIKPRLDEVA